MRGLQRLQKNEYCSWVTVVMNDTKIPRNKFKNSIIRMILSEKRTVKTDGRGKSSATGGGGHNDVIIQEGRGQAFGERKRWNVRWSALTVVEEKLQEN